MATEVPTPRHSPDYPDTPFYPLGRLGCRGHVTMSVGTSTKPTVRNQHSTEKGNQEMLQNQRAGAPVTWTIGPAGGAQDEWAARLAETPKFGVDDRGRQGLVATIITYQKNLAGDWFHGERVVQVRYLFDRKNRVAELDGTSEKPMPIGELIQARQTSVKEFLAKRAASTTVESLVADLID